MSRSTLAPADPAAPSASPRRWSMLALATIGFGLNFWAWALLSPLATGLLERGVVPSTALLVAVPVLVGSVGRIPVGALTDRFGGRVMFPLLSLATIVPVLFLGLFSLTSYPMLLLGGFFLGIAGTTFAIGVPYVSSWFPPEQRGAALGIYGIGMGGTAVSAFTTVHLSEAFTARTPFVLVAIVLAVFAVLGWVLMREAPGFTPQRRSIVATTAATMRLPLTWAASYLYALSFGGYVAFSVYLPVYLQNAFDLSAASAAFRMGGFVVVAVIMRPLGGVLADRIGAVRTLVAADIVVALMAIWLATVSHLTHTGTFAFLMMAVSLGLGTGAVFAVIGRAADPSQVGSVTGFVGAAGGLGGFVPPLILGALWEALHSYAVGLVALSAASAIAAVIALRIEKIGQSSPPSSPSPDRDDSSSAEPTGRTRS